MRIVFDPEALEDYMGWGDVDRKVQRKIWGFLKEISRSPYEGLGKPEPLRGDLAGWWSRRITHEHRLVYRVDGDDLIIAQCRGHYE